MTIHYMLPTFMSHQCRSHLVVNTLLLHIFFVLTYKIDAYLNEQVGSSNRLTYDVQTQQVRFMQ